MSSTLKDEWELKNKTHSKESQSLQESIKAYKDALVARGDLPHVTVKEQLSIIEELTQFPFGCFLLERKGANGFWTDYLMEHPKNGRLTGRDLFGKPFTPLEDFILNRSPVVVSTQERYQIFQQETQKKLIDDIAIASVPCGAMRDLLSLDFSNLTNFQLYGIDIDLESLELAEKLANEQGLLEHAEFHQKDAWNFGFENHFDIISSNGLNVYESDPEKVLDLYRQFYKALKPGGVLIIGVLTYPPGYEQASDWMLEGMAEEDIRLEQILYGEILSLNWRNFRTSTEIVDEFKKSGFSAVKLRFDKHHVFPTVIAQKSA